MVFGTLFWECNINIKIDESTCENNIHISTYKFSKIYDFMVGKNI